mgnify:CR=1 FL=1
MTMPLMRPRRKNPVLRTRQMNLPPWARSRVALGLTEHRDPEPARLANRRQGARIEVEADQHHHRFQGE